MARIVDRISFTLIGALALGLIAALAGIVDAGPLDPPGAPQSTMRTLDDVSGAWSRNLSTTGGCNSARFQCVLNDQAVLDRNTGLVWTRFPINAANSFFTGVVGCINANNGGVKGWRLPAAEELQSLVADGVTNPALPADHPFLSVENINYWTATFFPSATNNQVAVVNMGTGNSFTPLSPDSGTAAQWCVRGGRGYDGLR